LTQFKEVANESIVLSGDSLKAIRIHEHGSVEKLRFEDAPEPELASATDVVVKIKAASVNRADLFVRRGISGTPRRFPHILGSDGAGTIDQVGAAVKNLKPGDAVCIYPPSGCGDCEDCASEREFMCARPRVLGECDNGTYAEYVRVPSRNCVPMPPRLSFEHAAALPSVYPTVWSMMIDRADLKAGDTVLILGAGGGVATAALQLAAHAGARVIVASRSEEKLAKSRTLGAAYGINTTKLDLANEARRITGKRGADLVVDCIGGKGWTRSLAALAKGGRLVTCGSIDGAASQTDVRRLFWNNLKIFGCSWVSPEEFRRVLSFIDVTQTKPIIDRVFILREAAAAQERLEAGKQFGKIVLRVDD
jgi:NADPH:quinone reductase-like Zn-dependent oxidoreductase